MDEEGDTYIVYSLYSHRGPQQEPPAGSTLPLHWFDVEIQKSWEFLALGRTRAQVSSVLANPQAVTLVGDLSCDLSSVPPLHPGALLGWG